MTPEQAAATLKALIDEAVRKGIFGNADSVAQSMQALAILSHPKKENTEKKP